MKALKFWMFAGVCGVPLLRRPGRCRHAREGGGNTHASRAFHGASDGRTAAARVRMGLMLATVLATTGCVTAYQPRGATGGYVDRQLSPRRYAVEFHGNGKTSSELVSNMYLYRCADITVQQGFDVFVSRKVAEEGDGSWVDARTNVMPLENLQDRAGGATPEDFRAAGGYYAPIFIPGGQITTHHATGYIRLGRYAEVPSDVTVWDARAVLATLKPVVDGGGKVSPIGLEAMVRIATVQGRGPASRTVRGGSSAGSPGVTLDDLRLLLPRP